MKYLYQELQDKGLDARALPWNLAYSLPYSAKLERTCGGEVITNKPIKINKN